MNSRSLTDRIKNLSNKTNINSHLLISNYFFETIIKRIEQSKYKNTIAIHGGYLLGLFFGIKSRTTKDIDISLISKQTTNKDISFVKTFIREILNIDLKDDIKYELNGDIKAFKTNRINGYRVKLTGYKDKIRQHFSIDLTIDFLPRTKLKLNKFKSIIDDKPLNILHPIFEKIIADKLHAIIYRNGQTSRIRDFYDLHILSRIKNIKYHEINYFIEKLFDRPVDFADWQKILHEVEISEIHKKLWKAFQINNSYAINIEFVGVIKSIILLIKKLK